MAVGDFEKNHCLKSPKERSKIRKPAHVSTAKAVKRWTMNEKLLENVVHDILDGVPRYDVIKKLRTDGGYEGFRGYKESYSCEVFRAALTKIAVDVDASIDEKRKVAWARYENLYNEAMKAKNHSLARQILQDMVKLFGLSQEAPKAVVQVNSSADEGVVVNFGFIEAPEVPEIAPNVVDVEAEVIEEGKDED